MGKTEAAQRKSYKGKYKGPDRFKGDKTAIAKWKAEGRPAATATTPAALPAVTPPPETPTTDAVKPTNPDGNTTPNTFNPANLADNTTGMARQIPGATRVYKGKYAGKDKYKGLAPKGGKWKGKYIGLESRKGAAKPTVQPSDANALEDAVRKITS